MSDLIERLEAAPEGSRELDAAIIREVFGYKEGDPLWHGLHYTTSIDAALTLVPEWCRVESLYQSDCGKWWDAEITRFRSGKIIGETEQGALTPALALCIAALKAREAK